MNLLRKAALLLLTPIFCLLLFATAFDMGLVRIVDQPSNIKQLLVDSGIYSSAVDSLLSQAKEINDTSDGGGTIPLNNPTVQAAANTTITPQFVRSNTETVIDSVYAWLEGKTAQPNFNIDLTSIKTQFAATVAQAVDTRTASLPTCTAANMPSDFDGLNANCLPPGVTPAAAASEVQGEIVGGSGFLDNPVINANSIKSQGSSQSVFAGKLKNAPKTYQRAKASPIILASLTLLLALAIIFLSTSRRRGLRRVGIILVIIGLVMLAFAWAVNWGINQKGVPRINLNNAVLQKDVRSLVSDVARKIDHNYWIFGALYAVMGGLLIAAVIVWPRSSNKKSDDLEGEGKTKADRIDLRERDKVTELAAQDLPPAKLAPAEPAPKPKKTKNTKINVK